MRSFARSGTYRISRFCFWPAGCRAPGVMLPERGAGGRRRCMHDDGRNRLVELPRLGPARGCSTGNALVVPGIGAGSAVVGALLVWRSSAALGRAVSVNLRSANSAALAVDCAAVGWCWRRYSRRRACWPISVTWVAIAARPRGSGICSAVNCGGRYRVLLWIAGGS